MTAHPRSTPVVSPSRRVRPFSRRTPAAGMLVSLALHAGLLALGAIVVYSATTVGRHHFGDLSISIDSPGMSLTRSARGAEAGVGAGGADAGAEGLSHVQHIPPAPPAAPMVGFSTMKLPEGVTGAGVAQAHADLKGIFAPPPGEGAPGSPDAADAGEVAGVTFAGLGASTAKSVVYVVDCSGPMVTSLPMVLAEVRRSVSRLAPTQKFGVVLFHKIGPRARGESFASVLVRATPSAIEKLDRWLDRAEPGGRSCPLEGLEAALALKPDAIFLLSRSIERSGGGVWELGLAGTIQKLEKLDPQVAPGRREVIIQTIQFLDNDPTGIMQSIGTEFGTGPSGYRVIKRSEDIAPPSR